jgi:hypothetical protein
MVAAPRTTDPISSAQRGDSAKGGPSTCLRVILPRGIFGFMSAILVIPYFVRLDRGFDFRAVTGPLDRA